MLLQKSLRARAVAVLTLALSAGLCGTAQAATALFTVFASAHSTAFSSAEASPLDTGLSFASGAELHISAAGLWNGGACGDVGPDGAGVCGGLNPNTGINYYALVGRVGNGAYFKVGNSYDGLANSSGNLFLAFLDLDSANNTGFVTATVTTPVPEPAIWAMGLVGTAAVMMRRGLRVSGQKAA